MMCQREPVGQSYAVQRDGRWEILNPDEQQTLEKEVAQKQRLRPVLEMEKDPVTEERLASLQRMIEDTRGLCPDPRINQLAISIDTLSHGLNFDRIKALTDQGHPVTITEELPSGIKHSIRIDPRIININTPLEENTAITLGRAIGTGLGALLGTFIGIVNMTLAIPAAAFGLAGNIRLPSPQKSVEKCQHVHHHEHIHYEAPRPPQIVSARFERKLGLPFGIGNKNISLGDHYFD